MTEDVATDSTIKRFLKYWGPVLAMLSLMFYLSTDALSGENTRTVLEKIFLLFAPGASPGSIRKFNYVMRKTAHFTEYALLAWLAYRAFRSGSVERWQFKWAVATFFLIVTWSLLDEWHQSLTRTRGGSIYDSMLDSSGGLFMLMMIAISSRRRRRVNAAAESSSFN